MAKMRVSTSGSEATASDYTDNTPVFTATQNTARDEFNAAFEQHWANHADGAVYLHRVNGLSVYNPENWDADGIHLNTSGYSLVARASSQLSRILNAIL